MARTPYTDKVQPGTILMVTLLVATIVTGCTTEGERVGEKSLQRCMRPLANKLLYPSDELPNVSGVQTEQLDKNTVRVTGHIVEQEFIGKLHAWDFVCETTTTPKTEKLKITTLKVTPIKD